MSIVHPHSAPIRRAAVTERGGGGPAVRAADSGGIEEGVCRPIIKCYD